MINFHLFLQAERRLRTEDSGTREPIDNHHGGVREGEEAEQRNSTTENVQRSENIRATQEIGR